MPNLHAENATGRFPFEPLPGSRLFSGLDAEKLDELKAAHGPRRRAEREGQILRAGDPAPPLVTLSSGWAFRYVLLPDGRRQILRIALPGDTMGLDTLIAGEPTYPVRAAGVAVYSEVANAQAAGLLRDFEWFRDRALKALALERTAAELALIRMGQCTAEEATASVLLDLHDRLSRRRLAFSNQFRLELNHEQLADFVGVTAVHLGRTLARLQSRGLVRVSGHDIALLNVPDLERLAVVPRYCD
jgi:CRP/FNR family transcriptional regulator